MKDSILHLFLQGARGDCEYPLAPLQPPNPLKTLFVRNCFGSFLLLIYIKSVRMKYCIKFETIAKAFYTKFYVNFNVKILQDNCF